jgi:pimeloyl-ACP methyl ester carboxylesterase
VEASWEKAATDDGQTFVYRSFGDGPLIVLLHGFPDTPYGWERIASALADSGYRAVTPWLRGYHPDTHVEGRSYDPVATAEDGVALLDALDADDAILVGHDWGAAITYGAAALAPERFRAVVPVGIPYPPLFPRSLKLLWVARHFFAHRLPWAERSLRRANFKQVDRLYSRWSPDWRGPERDRSIAAAKQCLADPRSLHAALGYYRDASPSRAAELPKLPRIPALPVGGSSDFDPGLYGKTAALFGPGSEAVVLDGGHWPHRESEDAFIASLIDFVKRVDRPTAT